MAIDEDASRALAPVRTAQICDEGFTNVDGYRQSAESAALAANRELARLPIEIIELKRGDFTRTHAESTEQQQHGVIATPDGGPPIARREHRIELVRLERLGQRGEPPLRRAWDGLHEIAGRLRRDEQEAQQRAQCAQLKLKCGPLRPHIDEPRDVFARQIPDAFAREKALRDTET